MKNKNVILDSLETVKDYIRDKSLLKVKNNVLLQLFSSSNKKLLLASLHSDNAYVCFDIPENVEDYVELEICDLKAYSKYQLILLYEGWKIQDGITTALISNTKEVGFCYKDGRAVMRSLPWFSLPYRDTPVKDYTSWNDEHKMRWKEIAKK